MKCIDINSLDVSKSSQSDIREALYKPRSCRNVNTYLLRRDQTTCLTEASFTLINSIRSST